MIALRFSVAILLSAAVSEATNWRIRLLESKNEWKWDVYEIEWYFDYGCTERVENTEYYIESGHEMLFPAFGPAMAFDGYYRSEWGGRSTEEHHPTDVPLEGTAAFFIGMGGLPHDLGCIKLWSNPNDATVVTVERRDHGSHDWFPVVDRVEINQKPSHPWSLSSTTVIQMGTAAPTSVPTELAPTSVPTEVATSGRFEVFRQFCESQDLSTAEACSRCSGKLKKGACRLPKSANKIRCRKLSPSLCVVARCSIVPSKTSVLAFGCGGKSGLKDDDREQ